MPETIKFSTREREILEWILSYLLDDPDDTQNSDLHDAIWLMRKMLADGKDFWEKE